MTDIEPIVIETLSYRCGHNTRFVSARMISGPPNVVCHIGSGGEELDKRDYLEMILELGKLGWSFSVNAETEHRGPMDVVGNWGDEVFAQPEKYPEINVWNF